MDQRWRRNHDLPDQSFQPHGRLSGGACDVEALHRELNWLRNQLASTKRRQLENASHQDAKRHAKLTELAERNRQQIEQQRQTISNLEKELRDSKSLRQDRDKLQTQVASLEKEIRRVSTVAAEEQQASERQHHTDLQRLRSESDAHAQELSQVYAAIAAHESETLQLRTQNAELRHDLKKATELVQEERAQAVARVEILRIDHEAVELVCADLDHYSDRLAFEAEELRHRIQDLQLSSARDQQRTEQQARGISQAFENRLESAAQQVRQAQEEKKRLNASLLEYDQLVRERDALVLFKDQAIAATYHCVTDLEEQLQTSRSEVARLETELREFETRQDHVRAELTRTSAELSETRHSMVQREQVIEECDARLQQVEAAAQIANANAVIRARETEREFSEQCHRLRDELQTQREIVETLTCERALWQSERPELEQEIADARAEIQSCNTQLDAGRNEIRELKHASEQLRELYAGESERADQAEQTLATVERELAKLQQERDQRVEELVSLQDRFSHDEMELNCLQQSLSQCEQELERCREDLEQARKAAVEAGRAKEAETGIFEARVDQAKLELRERHDQIQWALRLQIEALENEIHRLAGDRETFHSQVLRLEQRLAESDRDSAPISEVRRLSRELARQTEAHARERAFLYERVDQLRAANARFAA